MSEFNIYGRVLGPGKRQKNNQGEDFLKFN